MSNEKSKSSSSLKNPSPIESVVVIGTGFVGLPLALLLADHGKQVVGVDVDQDLVEEINDKTINIDEEKLQALLEKDNVEKNLEARTEPVHGDAFVISVPTPLVEPNKSPDLTYIKAALESTFPYLEEGDLINIESTIPPLTCEKEIIPTLEEAGFTPGEDIQLAHSPERILPGDVFEEIVTNDRIIGGVNEISRQRAANIYKPFLEGNIYYTDLLSAELSKLMENTYRDINVALANEFALIGEELGMKIDEVISLANHHPRVDILSPGIGVGGHCLPVDPWFLNEVDPNHSNLITTARRINNNMSDEVAKKIRRKLSSYESPTILALGAAYKPNVDDCRNSPAKYIVKELKLDGYNIAHYDRYVENMDYENLENIVEKHEPDVVLQLVRHGKTVEEIEEAEDELKRKGIDILTFGVGSPFGK